jgi:signal transduction histidine kinase/FixJ family two-component response regulator
MIKVLVVDDERSGVNTAKDLRNLCGMDAAAASSAEECILQLRAAKISGVPFDAVVLDIYLPGRNGDEIVRELKLEYPYLAIVMLTAFESIDTAITTLRQGAFMYLDKLTLNTQSQLAPVLRAGVAQGRLKQERNLLAREMRSSREVFKGCAQIILQLIDNIDEAFLTIVTKKNGRWEIEYPLSSGKDTSPTRLATDSSIAQRAIMGEVIQLYRRSDDPGISPIHEDAKSLILVPIVSVDGGCDAFIELAFSKEVVWDGYTIEVMESVAELIAFHIALASRDALHFIKIESFNFAATQAAHFIRNALHVARNSVFEARELVHEKEFNATDGELTTLLLDKLSLESTFDEIQDVLIQMGAISEDVSPEMAQFDIHEIIHSRMGNYNVIAQNEAMQIELDLEIGQGNVFVNVDCDMLKRALDMLVENAIEACAGNPDKSGQVTLRISATEYIVTILVSDNGPSISDTDFEQLFEPKFSSKQYSPLRSVGLFTAQKLIAKNKGRLVALRPEKGAEFEIELPRVRFEGTP